LIERHNAGVTVIGLLDDGEAGSNVMQQLLSAGVPVGTDNVENALLHHKYAYVDHDVPGGSPVVITGSHNWSFNAENINDENTLFIHGNAIANQFHQEWTARNITGVGFGDPMTLTPDLILWPNPTDGMLFLATSAGGEIRLRLLDAAGRSVHQEHRHPAGGESLLMDVRDLVPGSYLIEVEQDGRRARRLFIRQ
jgi:phosphatidylserine/phosphatidylglycerophosphate/cardiolipin synthase-like enzyme